MVDLSFWYKKRVFLTGHSGFKGSWLSLWLKSMKAVVKGYSLSPVSYPNLFEIARCSQVVFSTIADIRNLNVLKNSLQEFNPDIVIHMAAQSLVRLSYERPIETYETNVIGTANILESIRHCGSVRAIINVTTDKCYKIDCENEGYKEDDPLGGRDPYSTSKVCSEYLTEAYRKTFFEGRDMGIATVRAGNVIGGGDWAIDRLVPDVIRAIEKKEILSLRNPKAIRPWQHVLEPLSGYLLLAQKLYHEPLKYSGAWNFGPYKRDIRTVEEVVNLIQRRCAKFKWEKVVADQLFESKILKLDISKALSELGWNPCWNLEKTLDQVIRWYESYQAGSDMKMICQKEINEFLSSLSGR